MENILIKKTARSLLRVLSQSPHRQAAKCWAAAQMVQHGNPHCLKDTWDTQPSAAFQCLQRLRSPITTLKSPDSSASIICPSPGPLGVCPGSLNFSKRPHAFVSGQPPSASVVLFQKNSSQSFRSILSISNPQHLLHPTERGEHPKTPASPHPIERGKPLKALCLLSLALQPACFHWHIFSAAPFPLDIPGRMEEPRSTGNKSIPVSVRTAPLCSGSNRLGLVKSNRGCMLAQRLTPAHLPGF